VRISKYTIEGGKYIYIVGSASVMPQGKGKTPVAMRHAIAMIINHNITSPRCKGVGPITHGTVDCNYKGRPDGFYKPEFINFNFRA